MPGLRWKIWSLNASTSEFAGLYLFDDAESVQTYLEGPIIEQVSKRPALSDISAKQFGVIDEFSAITRGPAWEIPYSTSTKGATVDAFPPRAEALVRERGIAFPSMLADRSKRIISGISVPSLGDMHQNAQPIPFLEAIPVGGRSLPWKRRAPEQIL